uniref:Telomeric single stranded DNA binding POT1/Cdc13 domain-containing protein n=1 Tax=Vitis vinifera TaxID=29760 RepID=A5AXJ1_VITVI|nr:hypothetical protein VITISV_014374 [Vitis vinifera]
MGGEDDYRFMAIEDAMASLNQKVNIIGVVVEMGMPKRSKGTGYIRHYVCIPKNSYGVAVILMKNPLSDGEVVRCGVLRLIMRCILGRHVLGGVVPIRDLVSSSTPTTDDILIYSVLVVVDAINTPRTCLNILDGPMLICDSEMDSIVVKPQIFISSQLKIRFDTSSGISVNVFAENMEKLPHVESAGDIIQFSHVVMKTHGQDVNAVFNKKFSSFAIFEGKYGEDFSPYQVSSNFRSRDQDKKFVKDLRKWLADSEIDKGISMIH